MNIFYLDKDFDVSARLHCAKHVVKMTVVYAQHLRQAYVEVDA